MFHIFATYVVRRWVLVEISHNFLQLVTNCYNLLQILTVSQTDDVRRKDAPNFCPDREIDLPGWDR